MRFFSGEASAAGRSACRAACGLILSVVFIMLPAYQAGAEQLSEAHVEALTRADRDAAGDAVQTLVTAGSAALSEGHYGRALDRLQRAQHLIHRTEGVRSESQTELLNLMAHAQLGLSNYEAAHRTSRFRYELHEQNYGEHDARTLGALVDLGEWYRATAEYSLAGEHLRRAIDRYAESEVAAGAVQSYAALAGNEYLRGRCCGGDLIARAAEQLANDPSLDEHRRFLALRRISDLGFLVGERADAESALRAASAVTSVDSLPVPLGIASVDRLVRTYIDTYTRAGRPITFARTSTPGAVLSGPLPICASQIPRLAGTRGLDGLGITLEVKVDARGKPRKVRTLTSSAPPRLEYLAKKLAAGMQYRPALEAGEPVPGTVRLSQTFDGSVRVDAERGTSILPEGQLAAHHGCHLLNAMLNSQRHAQTSRSARPG